MTRPRPPAPPRAGQRGASSIELAMLTPLLLVVIGVTIQFALLYHARHVALAAAQAGARVARANAEDNPAGWQALARAKSRDYVRAIGPSLLKSPQMVPLVRGDAAGNPAEVGMEVRGTAVQVVPFLTLTVSERSLGPVERFVPDT